MHHLPFPRPRRNRLLIGLIALAGVGVLAGGGLLAINAPGSAAPTSSYVAASSSATASPFATPSPDLATATPQATPSPSPSPTPAQVPLVPVVNYWSTQRSISRADLAALVGGSHPSGPSPSTTTVAVSTDDLPALAAALGVTPSGVQSMSAAQVKARVKANPHTLGIIRADDVTMEVRALAVDGAALFGAERIHDLGKWPLLVAEPGVTSSFSTTTTWTLAAGGDVMLDKAIYAQSVTKGKGADYAWSGGTAVIDSRPCCGWGNKPLASGHQTGNPGAVTRLLSSADLALVNLESPEPNNFTYHSGGFTFTGDPALLVGLKDAGIDLVGLANNHLGNGGIQGVTDTIAHLDALGLPHMGAGPTQTDARKAAMLEAGGLKIAFLAYCDIDPTSYWATATRPGSAAYNINNITADIKAAKKAGADMVFVMPHWGQEYTDDVWAFQRDDSRKMIAAGADMVLGDHSHWVGSFEQIDPDHLAFYSLGNFAFDWTHDERTQEGAVFDFTFAGTKLVQVDLHPTLIISGQPNLLDPAGDGQAVLGPVKASSNSRLGW